VVPIVIGTMVVLLGLVLYLGLHSTSTPAPGTPTPPKVVRLSKEQRQAASEASEALRSLQSVVTAGVTVNEYSTRVLDAKVRFDKAVAGLNPTDPQLQPIREHLTAAMDLYVFAGRAWRLKIIGDMKSSSSEDVRTDVEQLPNAPVLRRYCHPDQWDAVFAKYPDLPAFNRGLVVGGSQSDIWGCAREQLDEAQKVLG
jgi:hypothetical protein